jgi:hypothetical protein
MRFGYVGSTPIERSSRVAETVMLNHSSTPSTLSPRVWFGSPQVLTLVLAKGEAQV